MLQIARDEVALVLLQIDKMVFGFEAPVQCLDMSETLAQRFGLAIADDNDPAAPPGAHARQRRARQHDGRGLVVAEPRKIDCVDP